jgi:hypothetical protein
MISEESLEKLKKVLEEYKNKGFTLTKELDKGLLEFFQNNFGKKWIFQATKDLSKFDFITWDKENVVLLTEKEKKTWEANSFKTALTIAKTSKDLSQFLNYPIPFELSILKEDILKGGKDE